MVKLNPRARLLITVNDRLSSNPEVWEAKRSEYYAFAKFPSSFSTMLKASGVSETVILSPPSHLTYGDNRYFYSETCLEREFSEEKYCVVQNQCSREQIPLMEHLVSEGYDLIINFMPPGCKTGLVESSEIADEKYPTLDVITIICDGAAEDFYRALICPPEFR